MVESQRFYLVLLYSCMIGPMCLVAKIFTIMNNESKNIKCKTYTVSAQ
jgi:hypothetical protein